MTALLRFHNIIEPKGRKGMTLKLKKTKFVAISLILSFILLNAPYFSTAEANKSGSLTGYIFGEDCTTPVMGAVVVIRNISKDSIYESEESNELGAFKIDNIEEGLYVLGIWTHNGGFNLENIIGIRANESGEVSFSIGPQTQEKAPDKKDKKCPRGDWYYPEVMGKCDEGYRWNPKTLRCECKKGKGIGAFFVSPLGIVTVLATTVVGTYGIIKLAEGEKEVSPFK